MTAKTDSEVAIVRAFAQLSGTLMADSVVGVSPDPPDAAGRTAAGRRIAVEVTEYQADRPVSGRGGSPAIAAQSQQDEIARRAQGFFERRHGGIALWVSPGWATLHVIDVNRIEIAGRLARLVGRMIVGRASPSEYTSIDAPPRLIRGLELHEVLDGLHIVWGGGLTTSLWGSGYAAFMGSDPARFQAVIDRKSQRLAHYSTQYDERWLLIHVSLRGFGELFQDAAAAGYSLRGFDAVHAFDPMRRHAQRLLAPSTS